MEIDGFKSFARKTTIQFQPGMTGIIGPNGSGKSNIIEAIRWVMGEQSAKTLRGGKMVDVIFNGSKDHQPLNRAVVKMTLDNSDHYLKSEYSTITVTRKLYRNGESEYLINDHQVRLKDIVDLFIDSGIGRESFSIISQGRVAEIFNGQPSDRRRVIETVAGVAKYKQNKVSAEKKLAQTADRLDRVNDIIVELQRRIEPLKEESSLAQDYLEQKQHLDQYDRTKTVRQVLADQKQLAEVRQQLTHSNQLSADYDQKSKTAKDQLAKLQEQRRQLLQTKDAAQNQVTDKVEEIAKLENQQSLSSIRQEQREKDRQRLNQQTESINDQLATLADRLNDNQEKISSLKDQIAQQKTELREAKSMSAAERTKKLEGQLEDLQAQQVDLMQQLTSVHNERVYLEQNHERNQNVAKQDQQNLTTSREQLVQVEHQLAAQNQALKAAQTAVDDVQREFTRENQQQRQLQDQYEQTQKQWYQALGNEQSAQRQVKNYQAMAADYTGYYAGVQNVLKARDRFTGLAGSVSELIKVPAKYTTAIETVLGSQLQQLVVDTQATGKQIINYLIQQRGGRVTILPLDTLRTGWTPQSLAQVQQMPGFIGQASALIQYPEQYTKVVSHLLSTTVVADNLDHATAISKAGCHQIRVITLDGQLINASGAMTGGANRYQRVGLLSQKQQLAQLKTNLQDAQQTANQLEEQVQKLATARQSNQQVIAKLQGELSEKQQGLNQLQTTVKLLENQQNDLRRRVKALEFQSSQRNDQQQSFDDQSAANASREQTLNQQLTETKEQVQHVKGQISELQENASSQEQVVRGLEQQLAVNQERLSQLTERHNELGQQQTRLQNQLGQLDQQLQQLESSSADDQGSAASNEKAIADAQEILKKARSTVANCSKQQEELEESIGDLDQKTDRLQELTRAALNELSGLNDQKGHLEAELDQGLNRLSERYHMTLKEAEEDQSTISDEELNRQIKLLKRGLAELGNVNLGSIDEYKQVAQRYDFLKVQKDDLVTAKTQLESTMNEMDQQVKDRFRQTFNEVSASFAKTFQQIFNGGQAKLILTEPDNLLETGIDIMAQPPGKKNQQLSLLSGGEQALTAIALLFAILQVRPVPFAILDEPEAALDDVNVDRFADYLDKFGDSGPQFIVITHRKGTMRNADVLYGVTMQESGISEVVSVDIAKTLGTDNDNN